ncbi:unnamed protein product [Polarella glacialis]|uniref:Uncharacterized protein n=1 Tax=Polarella glacialis TaxID=89957 RepID=A0A813GSA7_POLGL|nr:unnamed protein product [Polarella glacialis]
MGSQHPAWSIPQLGPCFSFLFEGIGFRDSIANLAPPTGPTAAPRETTCGGCRKVVMEFAQVSRGDPLCRSCIRTEDETLLEPLEAALRTFASSPLENGSQQH